MFGSQERSPEQRASQSEREGGIREAEGSKQAQRNLERLRREDARKSRPAKRSTR
jgi:hypothetical protein